MDNKIQHKRSKETDMRFYWVIDRVKQKHLDVFWKAGVRNLGDYFAKHNSPANHKGVRPVHLNCHNSGYASERVYYFKCNPKRVQVKPMLTGCYNNT